MIVIGKHKVTCGSLISPEVDAMLAGERVGHPVFRSCRGVTAISPTGRR